MSTSPVIKWRLSCQPVQLRGEGCHVNQSGDQVKTVMSTNPVKRWRPSTNPVIKWRLSTNPVIKWRLSCQPVRWRGEDRPLDDCLTTKRRASCWPRKQKSERRCELARCLGLTGGSGLGAGVSTSLGSGCDIGRWPALCQGSAHKPAQHTWEQQYMYLYDTERLKTN